MSLYINFLVFNVIVSVTILVIWNRPAPPLPHLHLSEETVNEAAAFIRHHVNNMLSISEDISYGRDSRMFIRVALTLLMISVVGSLTDFFTLGYICKFKRYHLKRHRCLHLPLSAISSYYHSLTSCFLYQVLWWFLQFRLFTKDTKTISKSIL